MFNSPYKDPFKLVNLRIWMINMLAQVLKEDFRVHSLYEMLCGLNNYRPLTVQVLGNGSKILKWNSQQEVLK